MFQELLQKAQHIILRIKSRAATSGGLVGGGAIANAQGNVGPAVVAQSPMTPSVNNRRCSPPKSWHFDISNANQSESNQNVPSNKHRKNSPEKQSQPHQYKDVRRAISPQAIGGISSASNYMSRFTTAEVFSTPIDPMMSTPMDPMMSRINAQHKRESLSEMAIGSHHMGGADAGRSAIDNKEFAPHLEVLSQQQFRHKGPELTSFAQRVATRYSISHPDNNNLPSRGANSKAITQHNNLTTGQDQKEAAANESRATNIQQLVQLHGQERNVHTAAQGQR